MKKLILITISGSLMLLLLGCEQVNQFKNDTEKAIGNLSQQVDDAKSQAIDAKNKIDQKVKDVQDAAAAINKLTQ